MNYSCILFDLDGTVTDPKIGITKSVAYALQHFGITVDELDTLTPFIGPPLKDSFMEYYQFTEPQANEAVSKYREYFGETGLYENTVYPGMENLLQKLRAAQKTVLLATSKPTVFATEILRHFQLLSYFDGVFGSELSGERSRKGEVIAYALHQQKITNQTHIIMVGDRKHDIIGAKETGLTSAGVLYGYGNAAELQEAGADFIVEHVDGLAELLMEQ